MIITLPFILMEKMKYYRNAPDTIVYKMGMGDALLQVLQLLFMEMKYRQICKIW